MNQVYDRKSECCGCRVCENCCPTNAISMIRDEEGFFYPHIDTEKCIDCSICRKVCPYHCDLEGEGWTQRYYAVSHGDADVVKKSSSGGFFTALSDKVLEENGVVYGACLDSNFVVRHERATDKAQRERQIGSKYVQSDLSDVLGALLKDLEDGKQVLFTGTPCQIGGVVSFVLKKRKNLDGLILCDFICHGVSSPRVWADYADYLLRNCQQGPLTYRFRGKKQGWHQWYPIIKDGETDLSEDYRKKDSYILLYQTCFLNRECCYSCKYTSYDRVSDFTVADFWNVEKVCPEMNDNRGTSEVLVNTKKGEEWFEKCKSEIRWVECSKEDVWQPHLEYPEVRPAKRDAFWSEYEVNDFETILHKYGKGDGMTKLKNFIIPIAKKIGIYTLLGKVYKVLFAKKGKTDEQ